MHPPTPTPTPQEYHCPITMALMRDPIVCADGFSYERTSIERWFQDGHTSSPLTNLPLADTSLTPNRSLRLAIDGWVESHQLDATTAATPYTDPRGQVDDRGSSGLFVVASRLCEACPLAVNISGIARVGDVAPHRDLCGKYEVDDTLPVTNDSRVYSKSKYVGNYDPSSLDNDSRYLYRASDGRWYVGCYDYIGIERGWLCSVARNSRTPLNQVWMYAVNGGWAREAQIAVSRATPSAGAMRQNRGILKRGCAIM